jgi:hypothetical protein
VRDTLRAVGTSTGSPDIRGLLDEPWRRLAACRYERDDGCFFYEPGNSRYRPHLTAPSLLLALLICERCPVRRPCLRAALTPPTFNREFTERERRAEGSRVVGVWGGATENDRYEVRDLPLDEQLDRLEASFDDRLRQRIAAWGEAVALRPPNPDGTPRIAKRDRRIERLLGEARQH